MPRLQRASTWLTPVGVTIRLSLKDLRGEVDSMPCRPEHSLYLKSDAMMPLRLATLIVNGFWREVILSRTGVR